jgi:Flp pilus assembly pilin Flp
VTRLTAGTIDATHLEPIRAESEETFMRYAKNLLRRYMSDDSGQGMVEYILIIGLVVLFIIVAMVAFKDEVIAFIDKVKTWISGASVPE